MKIQNAFRLGLFGGLGVILAIAIGAAVGNLAAILTYIGAALFIALGLDPLISFLEKHHFPRWLATLTVLIGVLAAFTGLVFALIPVITEQVGKLVAQVQEIIVQAQSGDLDLTEYLQDLFPDLKVSVILDQLSTWVAGLDFFSIGGGVLQAGINIATAAFGGVIILILTLYFVSSLQSMKRGVYQLVPASKRARFIDIAEQITDSVGRYVVGQATLAFINGVLSFIFLSIIGAQYSVLLAFIAFLFSLVPLVGTLTGSTLIVLSVLLFNGWPTVLIAAIYYLIYMQIEAYVINPRIMNRAVKVPGVIVVIAALVGGNLLGVLGALVAIPVAASVLIIVKQVFIPRQNEL
ncbi:putative PurR-regulated permease PerM [Homoserinimonas aerilata]|uniref:Putative PurR-regulated permease PerM n=1 Tax=Homoserinimonas aerilata TaxID=1162970 RepID=A0A542YHR0_9MICO|nr:AI-2E family transporter [Homoserinimonas aerilata]TQL47633.1 putative PurR-regulated permease PerM [Homoserinimonas aerilata]